MFGGQGQGQRVRYNSGSYPGAGDAGGVGLDDILAGMFGGGGQAGGAYPPQRQRAGSDLSAETTMPFRQAVEGSQVSFTVDGRTVNTKIPAGVRDGQKIRLRGKGRPGQLGGPAGDLLVTVHVTAHPVFSLDGHNLRMSVPVTFAEAALGATIEVPTLDGSTVKVKVPAGTPSGRTLRVKGRGVKTAKVTGDLLVTVQVAVPQKLSKVAKAAVEALAAETDGVDVRADLVRDAAR
jgi:molecular chaperone DnaJ